MLHKAGKVLVPALLVSLAAIQSFGIDAGRAVRMPWFQTGEDSLAVRKDSILAVREAAAVPVLDSLREVSDRLEKTLDSLDATTAYWKAKADSVKGLREVIGAKDSASMTLSDTLRMAELDSLWNIYNDARKADVYTGIIIRSSYRYNSTNWQIAKLKVRQWDRDSLFIDSVRLQIDSFGYDAIDSLVLVELDSLEAVYEEPVLHVRDTLTIPDSLQYTDPFKYKYYLAIKDTTQKNHVRDSLMAIPDSAELAKFDSLYIDDSTAVAKWRHAVWYNSLSKKERKKYDYEQALPAKIHRMDSILARKDSIKAVKDSITENTPRILETYVVPDSMFYRRILTWTHDRNFNEPKFFDLDTSYNYHFYDYPFYQKDQEVSYLGMAGSAVQSYNWFKRTKEDNVFFYTPYQVYSYSPETLPQFNTKTPYTELAYWGTLFSNTNKEESNIKILTTQNITPSLNLTLEYDHFGGKGLLQKEATDNRTAVVGTNYIGKRYLMHAGYIYNKVGRSENGGAVDQKGSFNWIRDMRDTTLKDVREIPIHLSDANSLIKKHTFFLDQSYRIPFNFLSNTKEKRAEKAFRDSLYAAGDSLAIAEYEGYLAQKASAADSMVTDVTTAFIGHSSEYSSFRHIYKDNISVNDANRDFYQNYFYNPTKSADSLHVMRLENKVYLRLQPWKADGVVSKLDVGIGDKLLGYYDFTSDSYLGAKSSLYKNSLYVYAGAQGQYKKYLHWDADGKYTFLGNELNDFGVNANVELNFYPFRRHKDSPLSLTAHFETSLTEPDYYEQHIHTNHFRWDNDFSKTSVTKVQAGLEIPRWKLRADFGYGLLSNNLYYGTDWMIHQNTEPMSVITASLRKDLTFWKIHLDNQALLQFSSNKEVMPLPLLSLNLKYYIQLDIVKKVMQMQIGLNGWYNTKWNAPAWNPALGVFCNQDEAQYGNRPYVDAFVNIQWKRACIFVKCVNVNMGWPWDDADYFSAHHYIKPVRTVKVGIFWPFYLQPSSTSIGGGNSSGDTGERMSGRPGNSSGGGGRQKAQR